MLGRNVLDGYNLAMIFMPVDNGGSGLRDLFNRRRGFNAINRDELNDAFQHITWQALSTILHGQDYAKEVGDRHERDTTAPWSKQNSKLKGGALARMMRESLVDLVNNEYGRQLGSSLSEEFTIDRLSNPQGMSDFLNILIDDLREQFPELGGNNPMFLPTDRAVQDAATTASAEN